MRGPADPLNPWLRPGLAVVVLASLLAGLAGGLLRAGVAWPEGAGAWLGNAVAGHAFLMICSFMATVIGIERAVAVRHPLCFAGPLASGSAGLLQLGGAGAAAAWLAVAASLGFVAVNAVIVRRQRADHTVLLLIGAVAWAVGCGLYALGGSAAAVPWWFAFLVLTIAAERLEMTRLMRRRPGAAASLYAILAILLVGAALSAVLYGLALVALALWLARFDIARRTVHAHGLSRYMAVCLLSAYVWLGVAGLAWVAASLGWPARDAALHGLALGFVFGMVFGHAPVILPAIARIKLLFGQAFYLPLALLQLSLALRLAGGLVEPRLLAVGAAGNALAIASFAAVVIGSPLAWRFRHPVTGPAKTGFLP
jgi:hypothetical protein